jgi:hypothetical protein
MHARRLLVAASTAVALAMPLGTAAQQTAAGTGNAAIAVKGEGMRLTSVQEVRIGAATTIKGTALSETNSVLAQARVRLRNARSGRVLSAITTDQMGLFEFESVEPGSYVVELVGQNENVLAASEILHVNAGETASTVVKLPFRLPPFESVAGHAHASALLVTAAAAASGVLAIVVAGPDVSPRR